MCCLFKTSRSCVIFVIDTVLHIYVNILRSSQNVNFSDKYRNVYITDKKNPPSMLP